MSSLPHNIVIHLTIHIYGLNVVFVLKHFNVLVIASLQEQLSRTNNILNNNQFISKYSFNVGVLCQLLTSSHTYFLMKT